jgi:hypothetical protein
MKQPLQQLREIRFVRNKDLIYQGSESEILHFPTMASDLLDIWKILPYSCDEHDKTGTY